MSEAPFDVRAPLGSESPVIVEIPHAGLLVPAIFMPDMLAPARAIGRDADLYVDELYAGAHEEGATVLVARTSRYVADLNRDVGDFDAQSVSGGPDAHAPRGIIWRITTEGERALAAPLRREAFEQRLRDVYRPYHEKLTELISAKLRRFGRAVVLAAHSMPSLGSATHTDTGRPRADVVPGTRGRTSAAARFIDLVEAHAVQAGHTVVHDEPYKGGYVTQHYGRPANDVHVVQVEIARRLYMDEISLRPRPEGFRATQAWCRELVAKLGRAALV